MNWPNFASSVIIMLMFTVYAIASFHEPTCKDGYVGSYNLPRVGWVCVQGYKP